MTVKLSVPREILQNYPEKEEICILPCSHFECKQFEFQLVERIYNCLKMFVLLLAELHLTGSELGSEREGSCQKY